jgi:hypothetical protein
VNLDTLAAEGLIQTHDLVDPVAMVDGHFATLADLARLGILNEHSLVDWGLVDGDAVVAAGLMGPRVLAQNHLVSGGNVDLNALINTGLVSLGDVIEAGFVTPASLVGHLGFIKNANLLATNIADFGFNLAGEATTTDLVDVQTLLSSGVANLQTLLNDNLLGIGDLGVSTIGLQDLLNSGLANLTGLVDHSLVSVNDLIGSAAVWSSRPRRCRGCSATG